MKIKAVCEQTGLSDKTIRYYIRSGLIFPKYNENYTGRKNFDFSEKDIERLTQVVILRKYNFSISSIKAILNSSEDINRIVKTHIAAMKAETEGSVQLLARLNVIAGTEFSNAADLCERLSRAEDLPKNVPSADSKKPYKLLYSKNKKANKALIALLAVVFLCSSALCSVLYNSIRAVTDTSVININNSFVGLRIIEADDKNNGVQYVTDIYTQGNELITESDLFSEYSTSVEKSFVGRDTVTIHAVVHTDKAMVKIIPIYENRYSDELIYCNSSSWLGLDGASSMRAKSQFVMKARDYKYQYDIQFIPEENQ